MSAADPGDAAGPDAVEQLQRAVLTAIGTVRVALDALEAVVADRARLEGFAAGGREFVGSVLGGMFQRGEPGPSGDDPAT